MKLDFLETRFAVTMKYFINSRRLELLYYELRIEGYAERGANFGRTIRTKMATPCDAHTVWQV